MQAGFTPIAFFAERKGKKISVAVHCSRRYRLTAKLRHDARTLLYFLTMAIMLDSKNEPGTVPVRETAQRREPVIHKLVVDPTAVRSLLAEEVPMPEAPDERGQASAREAT